MHPGSPSSYRIVAYFLVVTLVLAFFSLASPLSAGTLQVIPQSPVWGEPTLVDSISPVTRIPSLTVDSQGTAHIVYCDKVSTYNDIFYTTVTNKTVSEPKNLTEYPSLKESVVTAADSQETLYVAFLDNRTRDWQVFLMKVGKGAVEKMTQITDTETHKEDVFLSISKNYLIITWTDLEKGVPHLYLAVFDSQGNEIKRIKISESPSYKASTFCDEKIHIVYLEKHVYDHLIYAQFTFTGEPLLQLDLGECIHADPVTLGVFKGPQFVIRENGTIACVWSDFRTGSHNLYYTECTQSGEIIHTFTENPGGWSWMPTMVESEGIIHVLYVNNGAGHRIFHSRIDETYEELGTVTSERERGTAPFLVNDYGILHCVYLQFGGDTFNVVYRNTYPQEKRTSFSEKIRESSITYVYSFVLSFLFSFPLTFKHNIWGIFLLVIGFFVFQSFNLEKYMVKWKNEYLILGLIVLGLSLLRGPVEYSFLELMVYEKAFIGYGLFLCSAASFIFKYSLGDRFNLETRILLSCLVFLYSFTFFLLLPVISYI